MLTKSFVEAGLASPDARDDDVRIVGLERQGSRATQQPYSDDGYMFNLLVIYFITLL